MNNAQIITANNIEAGMEIVSMYGSYIVEDVHPLTGGYVCLETTDGPKILANIRKVGILS